MANEIQAKLILNKYKEVDDFEIRVEKILKEEKDVLVKKCIRGLESKNDCDFYQATAAAKYVGRDKRLVEPLIKTFRKRRGWKRQLVLEVIRYLKYEE